VRGLALTPRWIGGLLFCLAAGAVCALLGRWQWDVAQHGSLQNTAYAFNWWLFSALFIGFWFKALRDTVRRDLLISEGRVPQSIAEKPRSRIREPAPNQGKPPLPTTQEDPDVAAWNNWLTELNADPQR
jgi:DNA-binding transcriptional regulator of glucitol operon